LCLVAVVCVSFLYTIRPIRYSGSGSSVIVVTDRSDRLSLLLCTGVLRPGLEADHSPVSSAGLRKRDAIFPLLNMHSRH